MKKYLILCFCVFILASGLLTSCGVDEGPLEVSINSEEAEDLSAGDYKVDEPTENRVLRLLTGININDGFRVSGASLNMELGEVYTFSLRVYSPLVGDGSIGLIFRTESENGWKQQIITYLDASEFQPLGWYELSGTINLSKYPDTITEPPVFALVKIGTGAKQEATIYLDEFVLKNEASGELVFHENFHGPETAFWGFGSTIDFIYESEIFKTKEHTALRGEDPLDVSSLKEIYADYFLIGTIINPPDFENDSVAMNRYAIYQHHYNALTFENDMKPDAMWGPRDIYTVPPVPEARLSRIDDMVKRMLYDGFEVIGHTLVWHGQSPNWVNLAAGQRERSEGREYKTYREAHENLKLFIDTIAGHFYNHPDGLYIHAWDVINEAISRSNLYPIDEEHWGYHTRGAIWVPNGEQWHSPWFMAYANETPRNGNPWDYVYHSFLYTRLADPSTILYYNDYHMEARDKVMMVVNMVNVVNLRWAHDIVNNPQADPSFETVNDYLQSGGRLLIEGIGMQQHDDLQTTDAHFNNVEYAIQQYITTGAKISITELDVGVPGYQRGQYLTFADEVKQGLHYARLFSIFKKYHEHIERVTFWGLCDNRNWRPDELCHIFDVDLKTKLAYYAVADPEGFVAEFGD